MELTQKPTVAWNKNFRYNTNRYLLQTKRYYEVAAEEARRIEDPIDKRHF